MSNEFLDDLFGDQEGIVYSPTKKGEIWDRFFFRWPKEREKLEAHIRDFSNKEVYISPALFSAPKVSPKTFLGSNYLWTEFDGTLPTEYIEPSMRIQSSNNGHEHWYWRLDKFTTDKVLIEDLTRRIAHHYKADLSAWDYQQVLRPPDTWNHKRNKPVILTQRAERKYSIDDFLKVPIPPAGTKIDLKLNKLYTRDQILAKYNFLPDTLDLLFKDIATGSRSSALARLAYDCIEAGLSNEETYVLIEDRDTKWGKFVGRNDRLKRLEAVIANARSQKAVKSDIELASPEVYRFADFMHTDIHLKWAIEYLLPVAGSMVILGKEGIGKTTFSLRLAMALALGKEEFLNWKLKARQKVLFVSLEMQHGELKEFFKDMQFTPEEELQLQEWFHVWPIGHAYPFDIPDHHPELLKHIDMFDIELVIIDSLGLSTYGSVSDNESIKRLNAYLNEDVRKKRKCGYIFIHHFRKKGIEEVSKVSDLDDSYGSRYITANAQTVIALSQKAGSPKILVHQLKTRMSHGAKVIEIERTPNRGFKLVGTSVTSTNARTQTVDGGSNKVANAQSLGDLLNL